MTAAHPSDSLEQRAAEAKMLLLLGASLGANLVPRRLVSTTGPVIEVDGVSDDGLILVECWAHQGPAKGSQRNKLLHDAAKLNWAASWLNPTPTRLLLCISDPAAKCHLDGTSWQAQAIAHLGVEILVVDAPDDLAAGVRAAQTRQFR